MATAPQAEVKPLSVMLLQPYLQDPVFLAVLVGVFSILVLVYSLSSSKKSIPKSTPTVLLLGPSASGKTTLFTLLALSPSAESSEELPATTPSLTSSTTAFSLPSDKLVRLVDLPGHPRLAEQAVQAIKGARGVVFCVDGNAVSRSAGLYAESLTPILTALSSLSLSSPLPPKLLILTTKLPSTPASSTPSASALPSKTRILLTREMDRLKLSRSTISGSLSSISALPVTSSGFLSSLKALFGLGGGSAPVGEEEGTGREELVESMVWGGKGGFRWEEVEGVEVEWGIGGVEEVREWLEEV